MPGRRAYDVHVARRRARVLGGDVAPAQVVDEGAERAEQRGALVGRPLLQIGRRHDHRLAAAVRQLGDGGLVGHDLREARDVVDGVGLALVITDAAAADGGTEPRRMNADQRTQPGGRVVTEVQLAVAQPRKRLENIHVTASFERPLGYNDLGSRRQRKCV